MINITNKRNSNLVQIHDLMEGETFLLDDVDLCIVKDACGPGGGDAKVWCIEGQPLNALREFTLEPATEVEIVDLDITIKNRK